MQLARFTAAAAVLALAVGAQTGTPQLVLDVNTPTNLGIAGALGNRFALGIAHVAGRLHVSAFGSVDSSGNWVSSAPNSVYVLDLGGNLVTQYGQDPVANASGLGYRDGATDRDPAGPTVFWGNDAGIFARDGNGDPKNTYLAANGIRTLTSNPIVGIGIGLGVHRAVAYDPNGDGGNGSWWTADFASDLHEIDAAGNVLTTHPWDGCWSIFGLAMDPMTGNLWANAAPNNGDLVEIDPASGVQTGRRIIAGPAYESVGAQGGLDLIPGGAGGRAVGGNDLVALRQHDPDLAIAFMLNVGDAFAHTQQDDLLIGKNGAPAGTEVRVTPADSTLDFLVPNLTGTSTFGVLLLTFDGLAFGNASIVGLLPPPLLGYVEHGFTLPHANSTPAAFHLQSPIAAGTPISLPVSALTGIDEIGAQAIMLTTAITDPGVLPAYPTNRVIADLCVTTAFPFGIRVEAVGSDSFNTDPSSGFFRITNPGGLPITRIRMTAAGGMLFDTDQDGMADRFDAGNSTLVGCSGTYRNGSDVATGLDYGAAGLARVAACAAAGSSSGFRTDGDTLSTFVEFDFAGFQFKNGRTFEFDLDTDGGLGVSGGAMTGMAFEIDLAGGTRICRTLVADPLNPNRSSFIY